MESKLLNHVEFKFIRNAYPLHEKLFCYFQTPSVSQWQPEIGDWVGLYKVGWSTLKEHKIRKQIQQEYLETCKNVNVDYVHITFEQHELPKDIEGLYQFVYVTKMDVVKGISTPFRFERVLPQVELRRVVDVIGKQQQQQVQQQLREQEQEKIQLPRLSERETMMGRIESELMKECQRLNLNWNRIDDTLVNGKLMQKYLNNIKLVQNDDAITKKVEDLFVENGKLCMSLKTRIQEVSELKRECDDIKTVNADLLTKLANAERKVEQLEREKDLNVRRIEEITRDLPRVALDKFQGKQMIQELEESAAKWLLQDNETTTTVQQPELKRTSSFYGELETPIDARIKLIQRGVEEQICLPQTTGEKRRSHLVEKLLREVDGTPSQVRLLKRVIEDLKCDNELLRERVRQVEGESTPSFVRQQQQQVKLPVKQSIVKEVTVCPRISLVPMSELLGEQRSHHHQSLPTMNESTTTLPSITVSTILPEQQQQQKSIIINGKVEQQQQQPKEWQQHHHQQQWQSIERPQWQQQIEDEEQQQPKQWKQVEQQQQLRGQVGEYLNRLDEQIRCKIEERLRNKLQEQLQGKIEQQLLQQQQQQQQSRSSLYRLEEYVKQQQKQQQQQWSNQLNEVVMPSQRQWQSIQQQQKLVEEQIRQLCPVCGIVMPTELNVCDFEIHVNSHFTD